MGTVNVFNERRVDFKVQRYKLYPRLFPKKKSKMREIVHMQAGQCGNQIGAKFWAIMSPALFWLISNPVPWTQSDRDLMDKFSDQITLFSDSREQETTGQRDITQKALNSSTQYWTLYEKNLNHVTAYKASN